jgi:hypothetical protein
MEETTRDNVNIEAWSIKPPAQKDFSHIKGWGVDADPKNDPTYPMRDRSKDDHGGYDWDRPPLQPVDREVLHSIERPNITAVFGTSVAPHGLSGLIRRNAFKFSEGNFAHWLQLILADRVNVVEGLVDDIKSGHFPNLWAEKGYNAEWKYNKKGLITKLAVGAALTTAAVLLLTRNNKEEEDYW